ncbi:MAG: beta-ketoacyl-ACP synthase III [Eubacteriales bacterium]|nr:beta-ketoacyl-ACP synthase III [Eubacteriales bacterium]
MEGIRILATGKALPKRYISNEDLSKIVDTNDEWIRSRTGIEGRYQCDGTGETCITLAVAAAKKAIEKAKIDANDIGLILVATSSADYALPSVACMVQKELGLDEEVMSFDLSAACTGFLYGMGVARGLLHFMTKPYALVIGSEQLSRIIDYTDRGTCILFGDGAGAAIFTLDEKKTFYQKSWTRGNKEALYCEGTGREDQHVRMDGKAVFRFAVTALAQGIHTVLEENEITMDDIDYVVCHQANMRIIDHVKKKFKGYENKFFINIESLGNTSAASIPIALNDLFDQGALCKGKKIICVGFGAGLTWSAALVEL